MNMDFASIAAASRDAVLMWMLIDLLVLVAGVALIGSTRPGVRLTGVGILAIAASLYMLVTVALMGDGVDWWAPKPWHNGDMERRDRANQLIDYLVLGAWYAFSVGIILEARQRARRRGAHGT